MFSFYIVKRYLLTKKSHHAINIISGISVCGVAIATAALVCILSVFNGFQDMVASLFTAFDPQLKVVPAEGKFMEADSKALQELKKNPKIAVYTEVLQDNVLLMENNRQVMATLKGVDDNFEDLVDFDRIKFGDGTFELHADVIDYGILGINLLSALGVDTDFGTPIQVYAPRGDEHIDLTDPSESFNQDELFSPNIAFHVNQQKYDSNYVITSLRFARKLFEREGMVSAIELKLVDGANVNSVKSDIEKQLGNKFVVMDRYEQQEDTFKIMNIEKLVSYIFLTFILMIACFNIIGSLSMLIIDKKNDAITLRNLGASDHQIANIFMIEGRMISILGAVIGIVLGLALCLIQQNYGIIKFGHSAGSYIIDSYPVSVHVMDIVIIFITVIIVGFISVWYPVRQLSKRLTSALAFLLVFTMFSCNSDENRFKITGTFENMPAGQLFIYNLSDDDAKVDTVLINEGEFKYGGTVSGPTTFVIVFPNALEQAVFVDKADILKYKASANDLKNYEVTGNDENELMNKFRKETSKMNDAEIQNAVKKYIKDNPSTISAVYLFNRYFVEDESMPLKDIRKQLNILRKAQPDNRYLKSLEAKVKDVEAGQIGKKLPNVTIETYDKKKINVSKLKYDYTVLVYWASWMQNAYGFLDGFVSTANRYQTSSKVKIITISLDTQIYRWEDMVKEDNLSCDNSCDGMAWDSPIVRKLGVTSVVTYIIADKNHKIIARGNDIGELNSTLEKYTK